MPITFRYDPELNVLFSTAEGLISFSDIEAHLNRELEAKSLGYRELLDATAARTDVTSEQVKLLVWNIHKMMQKGTFGPTAIVTNNDSVFGMARMFAILSDLQSGPCVDVFRTCKEALDWLFGQ